MFGPGGHRWFPIKDHSGLIITDDHGISGARPGGEQCFFNTEPLKSVGKIPNGFIVVEVRLGNPAFWGLASDAKQWFEAAFLFVQRELLRSEERHVGKECSARRWDYN